MLPSLYTTKSVIEKTLKINRCFKEKHSIQDRIEESNKIKNKYPDRIPVIVEKGSNNPDVEYIDKNKFLVPNDLMLNQLLYVIRKRIKVNSEKSLFLFCNGKIPPGSTFMSILYDENKDEDGFLYITYTGENTFG